MVVLLTGSLTNKRCMNRIKEGNEGTKDKDLQDLWDKI